MPRKLTPAEFQTIRDLLADGWRHFEIARELNLGLWTIARVADRRRFVPDDIDDAEIPAAELCEDDAPPDYVAQNLRRCPECGAMVYLWPCIACSRGASAPAIAPLEEVDEEKEESDPPATGWVSRRIVRQRKLKQKLVNSRSLQRRNGSPSTVRPEGPAGNSPAAHGPSDVRPGGPAGSSPDREVGVTR